MWFSPEFLQVLRQQIKPGFLDRLAQWQHADLLRRGLALVHGKSEEETLEAER